MSWKEAFSYITPEFVEHEVQGHVQRFYTVSVRTAFSLKTFVGPIVKALTTLLVKHQEDQTNFSKLKRENGEDIPQEMRVDAIPKDLAEFRTRERERALSEAISTLFDPDNALILGTLLVDSLREVFTERLSKEETKKFVDDLPLPVLSEMLLGLAKANKKVFGPLAGTAEGLVKRGLAAVVQQSSETTGETSKMQ